MSSIVMRLKQNYQINNLLKRMWLTPNSRERRRMRRRRKKECKVNTYHHQLQLITIMYNLELYIYSIIIINELL